MNNYYNKYKSSIGLQMISAVIIGTIFGSLLPQFSSIYRVLGKAFISLVSMVILPLVFPVLVLSVADILNKESLGKLILKSILYFFYHYYNYYWNIRNWFLSIKIWSRN